MVTVVVLICLPAGVNKIIEQATPIGPVFLPTDLQRALKSLPPLVSIGMNPSTGLQVRPIANRCPCLRAPPASLVLGKKIPAMITQPLPTSEPLLSRLLVQANVLLKQKMLGSPPVDTIPVRQLFSSTLPPSILMLALQLKTRL